MSENLDHNASRLIQEAETLAEAGSPEQAADIYDAALESDPENVEYAIKAGSFFIKQGFTEKAYSTMQDAAFHQPQNARIFSLMGLALINLGRSDEAEVCLQHAVDLDPEDQNTRLLLDGLKQEQSSGERIARAGETLAMILNYSDQPGMIDEILKRVDSSLLAVVRANAATAREEGQVEMADGLEALAANIENIIVQRILEG